MIGYKRSIPERLGRSQARTGRGSPQFKNNVSQQALARNFITSITRQVREPAGKQQGIAFNPPGLHHFQKKTQKLHYCRLTWSTVDLHPGTVDFTGSQEKQPGRLPAPHPAAKQHLLQAAGVCSRSCGASQARKDQVILLWAGTNHCAATQPCSLRG